jgi:hypothetical protein
MNQDQDFSALRNLLASCRLDMPKDTQVDQFLIEFHRRQRAQLLVRQSVWARGVAWMQEKMAHFDLVPSLSYATVAAAIAITAFVGLSQQVQVTQVDGQSRLTLLMPTTHETSFAMVPAAFAPSATLSPKLSDSPNFTSTRNDSAATRYVLANNSQGAHDATVAF